LAQRALEAGAARVYGVEVNPDTLAKAQDNLRRAGLEGRFIPLLGLSYQLALPEPVDLIVWEIIGNLGDNEDCTAILEDARQRFLKPLGAMLPIAITSLFAPRTRIGRSHNPNAPAWASVTIDRIDLGIWSWKARSICIAM
jgi:protein arginine N-methyltransferase 1